jgi:hypothetical protein
MRIALFFLVLLVSTSLFAVDVTLVDITAAARRDNDNSIALFCTREVVNELGTGGLLAPVAVDAEK